MKTISVTILAVCLFVGCHNSDSHTGSGTQGDSSKSPITGTGDGQQASNQSSNLHSLPEDSVCIPVFGFWTDNATGSKFDGLYDSVTSFFKYCGADKMKKVDGKDVRIDESNKCSKLGQITPMYCVINLNHQTQFCNILALDSGTNKMLILNDKNDTIVASTHKLSVLQNVAIRRSIYQPSANFQQMRVMEPLLKKEDVKERFIMHKSLLRMHQ